MPNKIQIRRGLFASLPTLDSGEFAFSTDTKQVHIGDSVDNHEVLMHHKFDAHTVLAAVTDNTPVAITVDEQKIIGRLSGGNIAALSIGIADDDMIQIDGDPADNEFAKFTANGLEGRTYAEVMADLSGQADAHFSMNSKLLRDGITPLLDTDYTIKSYVDLLVAGIGKKYIADVYANVNITLSGLQTIDSVVLTDGEHVLIAENQSTGTETGLWIVRSGAWERAEGWAIGDEAGASFVLIKGGTEDGNGFICTNDDLADIVGTDTLVFVQFTQAGGGANKQLSNLEATVAVNLSLIPDSAGKSLGSGAIPWDDLFLKDGGVINFANGNVIITHSTGQLGIGSTDLTLTGNIGRDTDNYLGWGTDNSLAMRINGVTHDMVSISDGAVNNDKLVTQGYVDDAVATADTFIELTDVTEADYVGHGYDLVRVNAGATGLEFMAIIDGGSF